MYIDLTTDYAFKRIFASGVNKDLLINFINEVFRGRKKIIDLFYNRNEYVGDNEELGSVILDLSCTAEDGSKIILEVQTSPQLNFKRRMLYYGGKLIADQAPKGNRRGWNYGIAAVYVIVLMEGFVFSEQVEGNSVFQDICLCNSDTGAIFYEDLHFMYIQLLNFTKASEQLESDLDRWLYILKKMPLMDNQPAYLQQPLFEKLFEVARYSKLNMEERAMYDISLKRKWDQEAVRQYQEQQLEETIQKGLQQGIEQDIKRGIEKGLERGVEQGSDAKSYAIIKRMIDRNGWSDEVIADLVEVTVDYVKEVRRQETK